MKVRVAKTAGFCWGVRRAIDKVLELRQRTNGSINSLGPLIHNPQAMAELERKGIEAVDSVEQVRSDHVVIRTHGIAPEVRRQLQSRALKICDGTCPRVAHIQSLIRRCVRRGRQVIIAGDPGHAEVIGLKGFAGGSGHVVCSAADVEALPTLGPVTLVAQTTFGQNEYGRIVEAVSARWPEAEVHETICDSTRQRQAELEQLAADSDVIIVIGGRASANTRRLAELAQSTGTATYHVESDAELTAQMLDGAGSAAVTAGASTPNWMIQRVVDRIRRLGKRGWRLLPQAVGQFLVASNLYVSIGAGLSTLLATAMLRVSADVSYVLIAACYIYAMHLLSHFADPEAVEHNEPRRLKLYARHKPGLVASGFAAAGIAIALSFSLGLGPGLLVLAATLAGPLYSIRIVPRWLVARVSFRRLKDIPTSKDLFIGIAWTAVAVIIPAMREGLALDNPRVPGTFLGIFALVYIRSVLLDIKELRGDRMVGKETLATVLRREHVRLLVFSVIGAFSLAVAAAVVFGFASPRVLLIIPPLLYTASMTVLTLGGCLKAGLTAEAFIDGTFLLAGALGGGYYFLSF